MLCASLVGMSQVRFEGAQKTIFSETPAASTGLNKIYVLYNTNNVTMLFDASNSTSNVKWYKYDLRGGVYAEEIIGVEKEGATTKLTSIIPNSGYIIEDGTNRTYVWVVDYSAYYLHLNGLSFASAQDCGTTALNVAGSGDDIIYATINGLPKKLDRAIKLTYNTLTWNSENKVWKESEQTNSYEDFKSSISVAAPLCNTTFKMSGDRFLEYWGEGVSLTSETYNTNAVDVQTTAAQEKRDSSNEKKDATDSELGGSAPATITFTAYCTDAVTTKEWQMSSDADFNTIIKSLSEEETVQTFNDAGTFYMRFIVKNSDGTCDVTSDTYTIKIGESSLICPNAFSPQSTTGINDEWKVQYKSIITFKCWIFNRWGIKVCELTDPAQGWDGKYKGKYVKSGAYYYVIQARGSDGKEYRLQGDINIINFKDTGTGTSTGNNTEE